MSVDRISATKTNVDFKQRILGATAAGAVAGGAYSSTKHNWIYKGLPSDSFVKEAGTALRETMTSDDLKESAKINRFLGDVVNPEIDVETLKPQIRESEELSAAIKAHPAETTEEAIARVFSKPKEEIKQTLIDLQLKTKADKKCGSNTARQLLNKNFDAAKKKLVKHSETSDEVFTLIKSAARKIQLKTIGVTAGLVGLATGAAALILSDVPDKKS